MRQWNISSSNKADLGSNKIEQKGRVYSGYTVSEGQVNSDHTV